MMVEASTSPWIVPGMSGMCRSTFLLDYNQESLQYPQSHANVLFDAFSLQEFQPEVQPFIPLQIPLRVSDRASTYADDYLITQLSCQAVLL